VKVDRERKFKENDVAFYPAYNDNLGSLLFVEQQFIFIGWVVMLKDRISESWTDKKNFQVSIVKFDPLFCLMGHLEIISQKFDFLRLFASIHRLFLNQGSVFRFLLDSRKGQNSIFFIKLDLSFMLVDFRHRLSTISVRRIQNFHGIYARLMKTTILAL
jgi:hypothetical protein